MTRAIGSVTGVLRTFAGEFTFLCAMIVTTLYAPNAVGGPRQTSSREALGHSAVARAAAERTARRWRKVEASRLGCGLRRSDGQAMGPPSTRRPAAEAPCKRRRRRKTHINLNINIDI